MLVNKIIRIPYLHTRGLEAKRWYEFLVIFRLTDKVTKKNDLTAKVLYIVHKNLQKALLSIM